MTYTTKNPYVLLGVSVLSLTLLILIILAPGIINTTQDLIIPVALMAKSSQPANAGVDNTFSQLTLKPGYSISRYADVPGARSLAYSANGTLFVGTMGDKVYAVKDLDHDNVGETVITVASGLNVPNGVALHEGDLFVAEINRILRYPDIETSLNGNLQYKVINADFPTDILHGWKFIRFGPDGMLYVPVGAPCNICIPPDERYAAIHRLYPDGTNREIFASGIRNSVGFDWDPVTNDLWFTDNGRDNLGDDIPPDELNYAPEKGMFFGYPYRHGTSIIDPEYGAKAPDECRSCTPPARELGPHVASLGMRFYTGPLVPPEYNGSILIAEHGSWNRKVPIGYRITVVRRENGRPVSYEPFIEGWLKDGVVSGRPVDIEVIPDGSLFISDDLNGAIYQVRYEKR